MYRFDRHPIMTGVLIGIWVTPTMTLGHLLFAAGCTAYVCVGVYFEERSLWRQWGRRYEEYCERVGSIVPSFMSWRSSKALGAGAVEPPHSKALVNARLAARASNQSDTHDDLRR